MVKRQGKGKGKGRERGGIQNTTANLVNIEKRKDRLLSIDSFFGIFNGGERHSSVYGRPGDGY